MTYIWCCYNVYNDPDRCDWKESDNDRPIFNIKGVKVDIKCPKCESNVSVCKVSE